MAHFYPNCIWFKSGRYSKGIGKKTCHFHLLILGLGKNSPIPIFYFNFQFGHLIFQISSNLSQIFRFDFVFGSKWVVEMTPTHRFLTHNALARILIKKTPNFNVNIENWSRSTFTQLQYMKIKHIKSINILIVQISDASSVQCCLDINYVII